MAAVRGAVAAVASGRQRAAHRRHIPDRRQGRMAGRPGVRACRPAGPGRRQQEQRAVRLPAQLALERQRGDRDRVQRAYMHFGGSRSTRLNAIEFFITFPPETNRTWAFLHIPSRTQVVPRTNRRAFSLKSGQSIIPIFSVFVA